VNTINKKEIISYWLSSAESDLIAAEHLFEKGDYHHCLFFGHLALEKAIKAVYVSNKKSNPPYKHSLPLLAGQADITLTEEQEAFLETVSDFNIEARYPDIKLSFVKRCTKEYTEDYFNRIKGFFAWLKTLIKF
jgi:HEPN domain-containing protein